MTQDVVRPPLPAKIFAKELESTIDAKYHHGVYGTGKRVVGRLMAYYTKDRRDVECQTASMSEITGVFDRTIARLEEKLKQADEDLLRGSREQDRLGAKLRILGQENKSLTDSLTQLQGEYEEMRRTSQQHQDLVMKQRQEISNLHSDRDELREKLHEIETSLLKAKR